VSEAIGGLLPQQKLDKIRELLRQGRKMVMVGGVNDAPAIRVNDPALRSRLSIGG
jgi:cation transport ATPase